MEKRERTNVIGSWHTALLLLSMCISGWFALRWLLSDVQTVRALHSSLPVWSIAVLLVVWVLGWVILGLGTVVIPSGRQYMRFRSALVLWIVSSIAGFGVVVFGLITEPGMYRIGGILIAGGLALHTLILVMLIFKQPPGTEALFSHIQSTLLFMAAFSISAGVQQDFVYRFPGFVLGLVSFLFFVTGSIEILSARPGLARLSCLWKKEPHGTQPETPPSTRTWWKFHGVVLLLCGVFFTGILLNNTFTILPDRIENTHSVRLDIPAELAWTWIVEPSHFLMWNTDFTEYIIPDITEGHVGTVYRLTGEKNEKSHTLECIITRWEEPREFSFRGSLPGYDVHGTYVIEPAGNGSVVTCTEVFIFRNLRERIMAVLSGRKPALQSMEERLTILQEVTGKR